MAQSRSAPSQSTVPLGSSAISALGPVEIKARSHARLSDGVGARSLDHRFGAAGGPALVPPAGGRDQTDLGLFLPGNERPARGAHLRTCFRQCARHIVVHACRRAAHYREGWLAGGSPEEQGFLRDVQGAACEQFNTVLAPGSNRFHYDHFHFDLMRRPQRQSHLQSRSGFG
jgi:hypothetical protein